MNLIHAMAIRLLTSLSFTILAAVASDAAQAPQASTARPDGGRGGATAARATGAALPPGYVIGADDVLEIVFWRERDLSVQATVRPDGKISLPLLNDVEAAGLTPDELRERLATAAQRYVADPVPSVIVKEIKSRKVYITGQVANPGAFPLIGQTTVLQLIALAGGLNEFADGDEIVVMRTENGRQVGHRFNYNQMRKRRNLQQNIVLRPGDTVLVP